MKGLAGRLEKLERAMSAGNIHPACHQFTQEEHETREQARSRYEAESGCKVGPDDLVITRVIVSPRPLATH